MTEGVLDSPHSWVVAVAASLTYFIMYGLSRVSGQLFVATLDHFDTNREAASFPFTLSTTLRYLCGPVAGYLARIFGIQSVILLGCVLSFVGIGACSVAKDIVMVTMFWGGLYGLGSCFSSVHLRQLNNLYFRKHLAKSNGLSLAGSPMAGFVLPPLIELFLQEYGLQGTYLLLSGIALNGIAVGILLKEPPGGSHITGRKYAKDDMAEEMRACYRRSVSNDIPFEHAEIILHSMKQSSNCTYGSLKHSDMQSTSTCGGLMCTQKLGLNIKAYSQAIDSKSICTQQTSVDNTVKTKHKDILSCITAETTEVNENNKESPAIFAKCKVTESLKETSLKTLGRVNNCQCNTVVSQTGMHNMETLANSKLSNYKIEKLKVGFSEFDIFLSAQYLTISFATGIHAFFCYAFPTILIDSSRDKGISLTNSTYLLMTLSATDMLGRLSFGWVTDRGYLSLTNFAIVCFSTTAASMFFWVWSSQLYLSFVILSLMGLSLGAMTPLFTCLITEYIKSDRQRMANASVDVMGAPFVLATSSMIGFFRDELGSYDWFIYILSLIALVCCIMLSSLSYLKKKKTKTKLEIFKG